MWNGLKGRRVAELLQAGSEKLPRTARTAGLNTVTLISSETTTTGTVVQRQPEGCCGKIGRGIRSSDSTRTECEEITRTAVAYPQEFDERGLQMRPFTLPPLNGSAA